jgi:hypothetical protein
MKKKAKVEVPDNQVRKQKMANGRYAVTATVDGTKVFKFLSEKDYRALNAPEAT